MSDSYTEVFSKIERLTPQLSEWTSIQKAQTLASLVIALRPRLTVEIGVWQGASAIPMALAHRAIGYGHLIAIDAWDAKASVEGQVNNADADWWAGVDHEKAYQRFLAELHSEGLSQFVNVIRRKSDDVTLPDRINLWHSDGNHGEQAVKDVQHFEPHMARDGVICLDDYNWAGGGVKKAVHELESRGWRESYPLGTGGTFRRAP